MKTLGHNSRTMGLVEGAAAEPPMIDG